MQVSDGHLLQTWEEGDLQFGVIRSLVRPVTYDGVQWPQLCDQRVPLPSSTGQIWLLPGGRVAQLQGRTLRFHALEQGALDVFHGHLRINLFAQSHIPWDWVIPHYRLTGLTEDQFNTLTGERHGIPQVDFDALANSHALIARLSADFPNLRIQALLGRSRNQLAAVPKGELSTLIREIDVTYYLDATVNIPLHGHTGDDFCLMTRDPFHGLGEVRFHDFNDQQFVDALLHTYGVAAGAQAGQADPQTILGMSRDDLLRMTKIELSAHLHASRTSCYADPATLPLYCFGLDFATFQILTESRFHGLEQEAFDPMNGDAFRAHLRATYPQLDLTALFDRTEADVNQMTRQEMSTSLRTSLPFLQLTSQVAPRLCGLDRAAFTRLIAENNHGLQVADVAGTHLDLVTALGREYPNLNWEQFLGTSRDALEIAPRTALSDLIKSKGRSDAPLLPPERLGGLTPEDFHTLTATPYHGFTAAEFSGFDAQQLIDALELRFDELDLEALIGPIARRWDTYSRDRLRAQIRRQRLTWQPYLASICGLDHPTFDALTQPQHGLARADLDGDYPQLLNALAQRYQNLNWQEMLGIPLADLHHVPRNELSDLIKSKRVIDFDALPLAQRAGLNEADFRNLTEDPFHGFQQAQFNGLTCEQFITQLGQRYGGLNLVALIGRVANRWDDHSKTRLRAHIHSQSYRLQLAATLEETYGIDPARFAQLTQLHHGLEGPAPRDTVELLAALEAQFPGYDQQAFFHFYPSELEAADKATVTRLIRHKLCANPSPVASLCGLSLADFEKLTAERHGMGLADYDALTTQRLLDRIRQQYPSLNERELFSLTQEDRERLDLDLLRSLLRIKRPRRQIDLALLPLVLREFGTPVGAAIDPATTIGTPNEAHTAVFNQLFQQHRDATFLGLFDYLTGHPEHVSLAVIQNMCHNVRSTKQLTMTYLLALAEVKQAQHARQRRKLKVLRNQLKWTFYRAADVRSIRTPDDFARYRAILRSAMRHRILNEGECDALIAVANRSLVFADARFRDVIARLDRHDQEIAQLRVDVHRVQDELTSLKEKLARDKRNEAILSVFKALAGMFGGSLIDLIGAATGAVSALELMEKVLTDPLSFVAPILDHLPDDASDLISETLGIFSGAISEQAEEKFDDTILGLLGWDEEEADEDAPMAVHRGPGITDPEEAWLALNQAYLEGQGLGGRRINVVNQ